MEKVRPFFFWHISNPRFFRPRVAFPTTAFSPAMYTYIYTKKRYSPELSMYHCGNNHYLNHWNFHQMSKLLSANLQRWKGNLIKSYRSVTIWTLKEQYLFSSIEVHTRELSYLLLQQAFIFRAPSSNFNSNVFQKYENFFTNLTNPNLNFKSGLEKV